MPIIACVLGFGGKDAGFVFPLFQNRLGANELLFQRIAMGHRIEGFDQVDIPRSVLGQHVSRLPREQDELSVLEGGAAIYGVRDDAGRVDLGNFETTTDAVVRMISEQRCDSVSLSTSEMILFFELDDKYIAMIAHAYKNLSASSSLSSEIWRERVLSDRLRSRALDLEFGQVASPRAHEFEQTFQAIRFLSKGDVMSIAFPNPAVQEQLSRSLNAAARSESFLRLAHVMGVHDVQFSVDRLFVRHVRGRNPFENEPNGSQSVKATAGDTLPVGWSILANGASAKHVLEQCFPRFMSRPDKAWPTLRMAANTGPHETPTDLIVVFPSDKHRIEEMMSFVDSLGGRAAMMHAINIRPIGFGTPSAVKLSFEEVLDNSKEFRVLWVISNHRNRKAAGLAPNLSALHRLSGTLRHLLRLLVHGDATQKLNELKFDTSTPLRECLVCQFSSTRLLNADTYQALFRRMFLDLISEELIFAPSTQFHMYIQPANVTFHKAGAINVSVGNFNFMVTVSGVSLPARQPRAFLVAAGVLRAKFPEQHFFDFCVAMLDCLGYRFRDPSPIRYGDVDVIAAFAPVSGRPVDVYVAGDRIRLHSMLSRAIELSRSVSLVITKVTIDKSMRDRVSRLAPYVFCVHYSELHELKLPSGMPDSTDA